VELFDQSPGEVVADAVAVTPPLSLADHFDWSPTLPSAGDYAVYAKWQAADDRATDATYEITHSGGVDQVTVDQTHNGGEWRYLGTWSFDPGQGPKVSLLASLGGTVDADAVRFVSGDAIGGTIAYSHTDQLGTIQKLTDATDALVWDRIARPFGDTVSISAATGVEQKQRFPGQYVDETGLSYNYFRDYDPTLGRYVESDPIGLAGGINTYGYVDQNPIKYADPSGQYALLVGTGLAVACFTGDVIWQVHRKGCVEWKEATWWGGGCFLVGFLGAAAFEGLTAAEAGAGAAAEGGAAESGSSKGPIEDGEAGNPSEGVKDGKGGDGKNLKDEGTNDRNPNAPNRPGVDRGLPPDGVHPPEKGPDDVTVGPASRPSEAGKGGKSLWDKDGGEWRWFPGDKYHNPHWDYNPHDTPNSPWQNIPAGNLPVMK
jgi:RHS repeat-associated protein